MFKMLMEKVEAQQETITEMKGTLEQMKTTLDNKLDTADYEQALPLYATKNHVAEALAIRDGQHAGLEVAVSSEVAVSARRGAGGEAGAPAADIPEGDFNAIMAQLAAKATESYVDNKIDDAMRVMNMRYGKLIFGSPNNDRDGDALNGSSGNDIIYGEGGDDNLFGLMGHDTLHGGSGNDMLDGYDGADVLYGDGGNDYLYGGNNDDILLGGSGTDYVYGDHGDDIIYGGHGSDYLYGEDNDDVVRGENGNDYIEGNDGDDQLYGGKGYDWLFGGKGDDIMYGEQDYDIMYGGPGDDVMAGGGSTDVMYGDGGDDWIEGGEGKDKLYGDYRFPDGKVIFPGNDYINARDGEYDYVSGGPGNDVIITDFDIETGMVLEEFVDGGPGCDVINGRLDPNDAVQRVPFFDLHGVSLDLILTNFAEGAKVVKVEYKHEIRDAIAAELDNDEEVDEGDLVFDLGDAKPQLKDGKLDAPVKGSYNGQERVVMAVAGTGTKFALKALTYSITLDGNPDCAGTFIPKDKDLEKTLQDLGIDPEQWMAQNYGAKTVQHSAQHDDGSADDGDYPDMGGAPGVLFDDQGNVVPDAPANNGGGGGGRRNRANNGGIEADPDDSV